MIFDHYNKSKIRSRQKSNAFSNPHKRVKEGIEDNLLSGHIQALPLMPPQQNQARLDLSSPLSIMGAAAFFYSVSKVHRGTLRKWQLNPG
jgi:hypothetical protein